MDDALINAPEHEHSVAIAAAAEWLRSVPQHERLHPIVPALRERFGLTALQAVEAIREANYERN